jgi:hypothetical protein
MSMLSINLSEKSAAATPIVENHYSQQVAHAVSEISKALLGKNTRSSFPSVASSLVGTC